MHIPTFLKNRMAFSREELLLHLGNWVAFDENGQCILAAAETLDQLEAALAEKSIDPELVHFEYLPAPDEDAIQLSPETRHEVPVSK